MNVHGVSMGWSDIIKHNIQRSLYRVTLERLQRPIASKSTYMDAHVCATGGKGGVVLPVDIKSWSYFNARVHVH